MESQWIILVCIFVPLLGSFLLPFLGRLGANVRNLAALIFVLVSFVCSALSLRPALAGSPLRFWLELPQGLSFGFLADGLAVFVALVSALAAAVIIFYSFAYIERYENQNEYYTMVVLFTGAVMGLVFSTNLIFIYAFWEITSVCGWRLIGFHRGAEDVRRADKAFLVNMGGALLMLTGFIGLYMSLGTFNLLDMQGRGLDNWIMVMILFGVLSKSAILPLHTWLPESADSPAPIVSLLGGAVLVNMGVYVFARLFLVIFQPEPVWQTIVPAIAVISSLVAAGAALREKDLMRLLCYSTICQLGFILLGLSCGVMIGAAGGLTYILMHALAAGGLFLCAGMIKQSCGVSDLDRLGGLAQNMPITAACFALCAFSVMGLPPFGGFFAKYMIISGAVQTGMTWLALLLVLASIMTVVYLLRAMTGLFFGPLLNPDAHEGSWEMVISLLLFGSLSLIIGLCINVPANITSYIVESLGRW